MILSRRFDLTGIARFLAIWGLFFLSLPSLGQGTGLNLSGASNCTVADFDANVQFANEPGNYYAIIIDKRNISSHPCVFDGPMYGPSVVPDRVPGDRPFALCYDCENRLPNGQYPIVRPLTLDSGQVVRQTFRWKTAPPSEAIRCLEPKWMSGPTLLVAPSLLKQICSDIEVSRFSLAPSSESAATTRLAVGAKVDDLKLASNKSTYYEGEMFSLRVSRTELNHETPSKEDSCPTLYLRERSPSGATRIDEVQPLAFKGCSPTVLGHEPGDWQSGFDLGSGAKSKWEGAGEHEFELFQLSGSIDEAQVHFVSSNILRIQIADPTAIHRRWGQRLKGIAADITLDKDTYRVGEDVPLHLALKDFDADVSVYSWDPAWDPCMVVGIEVQDAGGHPLPANERFPDWSTCFGHGMGPRPFPKGKVVPIERTLGNQGWLPNHPGTFTIVITWAPCFGPRSESPAGGRATDLKPYATVHATARIHLVSDGGPLSN